MNKNLETPRLGVKLASKAFRRLGLAQFTAGPNQHADQPGSRAFQRALLMAYREGVLAREKVLREAEWQAARWQLRCWALVCFGAFVMSWFPAGHLPGVATALLWLRWPLFIATVFLAYFGLGSKAAVLKPVEQAPSQDISELPVAKPSDAPTDTRVEYAIWFEDPIDEPLRVSGKPSKGLSSPEFVALMADVEVLVVRRFDNENIEGVVVALPSTRAGAEFAARVHAACHKAGTQAWIRDLSQPGYLDAWASGRPLMSSDPVRT